MARIFEVERNPILSANGRASLILLHADSSHDGGGYVYRFELLMPTYVQGPLSDEVLVTDETVFDAKEYYSKLIENYDDLDFVEKGILIRRYKEEFGITFFVRSFNNLNFEIISIDDRQLEEFSSALCQLYLLRYSSYALNNDTSASDDARFYPDKIVFSPYKFPARFQKTVRSEEVFGR